ncbi:hypothetical protein AS96_04670 [Microbacterium sp. MRS-1]|nr:hypothetical protein AS96_04670 [Microbacterium sp. MRS-1]
MGGNAGVGIRSPAVDAAFSRTRKRRQSRCRGGPADSSSSRLRLIALLAGLGALHRRRRRRRVGQISPAALSDGQGVSP